MKYFLSLLLASIIGIGAADFCRADIKPIVIEKQFSAQRDGKLYVEVSGADIRVTGWETNSVNVRIRGSEQIKKHYTIEIEKTSDGVSIKAKRKGGFFSQLFNNSEYSMEIEVFVPDKYNAFLKTSGGDVILKHISGAFDVRTSGGDICFNDCSGKSEVGTSGGDIQVERFEGSFQGSTSGGDIDINSSGNVSVSTSGGDVKLKVSNGKIHASTTGGDMELDYRGENKGIELSTSGGDIAMHCPDNIKAHIELSSSGGDLSCSLSNCNVSKQNNHRFIGDTNGGGPKISASTSGGSVSLNSK